MEHLIKVKVKPGQYGQGRTKFAIYCVKCGKCTNGGKPVCADHIFYMKTARRLQRDRRNVRSGAKSLKKICPPDMEWLMPFYRELE